MRLLAQTPDAFRASGRNLQGNATECNAVTAGCEMEKLMDNSKNTYKYVLKVGDKVVYRGVTNDLKRRQAEHRVRWPDGQVQPVGRKTTMEQALDWMRGGTQSHEQSTAS